MCVRPALIIMISAPAKRVMSLKQPNLKMSKSHADLKSRILITDTPDEIMQKIRLSLTDSISGVSYDPVARPGVANLLDIMTHLSDGSRSPEALAEEYESSGMREFKQHVADCIIEKMSPIRKEYHRVIDLDGGRYLDAVAARGAENARANAGETMAMVRSLVGLG
ncbi:MAG: mitochondrial 37S ribosomal protein rsm10 [Thelocarpon impressellum]|nr:MAG: mitochondrial 37S ribosomal protein rsm10 [Thelocarpon impressellum]